MYGKRLGRVDDRPVWVPFGTALKYSRNGLTFRAMDIVNQSVEKAKEDEDNSEDEDERAREFALHRQQILLAAKGDNTTENMPVLTIGPLDRRAPRLLQITQAYMSAEEPMQERRPVNNPGPPKESTREVRYNPNNDPGIEPRERGRGSGRRGGGRRGRGRRRGGPDGDDYGDSAPPPRTSNLMDFVTQQLGGMSSKLYFAKSFMNRLTRFQT